MEFGEERLDEVLVLKLQGRIDGSNSGDFETTVAERIDAGNSQIVLDFENVNYISSAGLRAVLILAKKLSQGKGQFALCAMQPSVQGVFEVSGFIKIIKVHPDRETAVSSMQAAGA